MPFVSFGDNNLFDTSNPVLFFISHKALRAQIVDHYAIPGGLHDSRLTIISIGFCCRSARTNVDINPEIHTVRIGTVSTGWRQICKLPTWQRRWGDLHRIFQVFQSKLQTHGLCRQNICLVLRRGLLDVRSLIIYKDPEYWIWTKEYAWPPVQARSLRRESTLSHELGRPITVCERRCSVEC